MVRLSKKFTSSSNAHQKGGTHRKSESVGKRSCPTIGSENESRFPVRDEWDLRKKRGE